MAPQLRLWFRIWWYHDTLHHAAAVYEHMHVENRCELSNRKRLQIDMASVCGKSSKMHQFLNIDISKFWVSWQPATRTRTACCCGYLHGPAHCKAQQLYKSGRPKGKTQINRIMYWTVKALRHANKSIVTPVSWVTVSRAQPQGSITNVLICVCMNLSSQLIGTCHFLDARVRPSYKVPRCIAAVCVWLKVLHDWSP